MIGKKLLLTLAGPLVVLLASVFGAAAASDGVNVMHDLGIGQDHATASEEHDGDVKDGSQDGGDVATDAPGDDGSGSDEGTDAHEPEATATSTPKPEHTEEPHATSTPRPEHTEEPHATATPGPEHTEEPHATSTPEHHDGDGGGSGDATH